MQTVKEFMQKVWGLDYQLYMARDDQDKIKCIVDEANCNLQLVTMLAEDAMEAVAAQTVTNGVETSMQELTRIERVHTHYVDTLAQHNTLFA